MKWVLIYDIIVITSLLHSDTICAKNPLNTTKSAENHITVYTLEVDDSTKRGGMSKSLKLHISWLPSDEGRQPTSYRVVVESIPRENDVNRLECTASSVNYTVFNVTHFNMLVPKGKLLNSTSDMQIRPNCTYKIQVHDLSNPSTGSIEELQEVIYTVPECMGHKCSCARDMLPVPTVEVIQTMGKIIINWNVTSNSNVRSYVISIGPPDFMSKAGLLVYNKTQISKVTSAINTFTWDLKIHNQYVKVENGYKVFVAAIDRRGCSGIEGHFTIITADETEKSHKNILTNNITVYVFEDENSFENGSMLKSLKLNVSWIPPDKGRRPSSYSVVVESIPKKSDVNRLECTASSVNYTVLNVTHFNMLVPKGKLLNSTSDMQIRPNCTYKIQVYDLSNPNTGSIEELQEVIYTVPKCIKRKYNCTKAGNILPVPTVEAYQTMGKVIINWKVISNCNVHFYVIKIGTPLFKLRAEHYNITQISNVTSATNTFIWDSKVHNQYVRVESGYKIFVAAIDHRGCSGAEGNFTIITVDETETSFGDIIWILIGLVTCIIVLICISQYFVSICNKNDQYQFLQLSKILRKRQPMSELPSDCKLQWPEETYCEMHENDKFEVTYSCINLQYELSVDCSTPRKLKVLGKGQFGKVYLGSLNNNMDMLVAVKMSQCSDASYEPEARRQLLEEIEAMKTAGSHPHLVSLIGCCTSPDYPICILLEYMEGGDLLTYLHRRRKIESDAISVCNFEKSVSRYVNIIEREKPNDENSHDIIQKQQFLEFALDIAKGMEHLEAKEITHRDLAARNILLTSDLKLKISDFGLSRNGIYVINHVAGKVRQLPIRWMSPEAVRDYIFSSKSDVWSFGIVLWEIGTLGSFPYSNIQDEDLLCYLTQNKCRLTCPDSISHDIYKIMCSCWNIRPQDRPNFTQLVLDLQTLKESLHSVHETSNPCYMLLSQ